MGFGHEHDLFLDISVIFVPEDFKILKYFCNGNLEDCTFNTGPNANYDLEPEEVSFYPNPAKDLITIETDLNLAQVHIVDLLGKVVYSTFQIEKPYTSTINTSLLENGVYFIQVLTEDHKRWTSKFIKG